MKLNKFLLSSAWVLIVAFVMVACGKSEATETTAPTTVVETTIVETTADNRTKEEKLSDGLYKMGKDALKDAGYIDEEKADKIDDTYGSIKDAVKSVKGLFGD